MCSYQPCCLIFCIPQWISIYGRRCMSAPRSIQLLLMLVYPLIWSSPSSQLANFGIRNRGTASTPDLLGGLDDEAEFVELLLAGKVVTLERGGEPALGREAELVYLHEAARLFDAPLELVLGL